MQAWAVEDRMAPLRNGWAGQESGGDQRQGWSRQAWRVETRHVGDRTGKAGGVSRVLAGTGLQWTEQAMQERLVAYRLGSARCGIAGEERGGVAWREASRTELEWTVDAGM